ncbi:mitochondrial nicotinamide adenine dinucleotide transporter SLC25A51 [Phymastichus coffea]|uniref:mitochondrial nicotinamide adenine dinucleotide transporter SLC25A51 n=1 Tax=Phymastichus coffea TaxID=108790 RepID=UPI00273CB337|nr:mitochondrial nicotinamide adenine dinucleotide transporter SLC25A51 [Phymastichus coffea]XP_058798277.1 mitochondrial nicotinamide adenine dinucleotide transporter SLC25A51 [Phymastichus coffea]
MNWKRCEDYFSCPKVHAAAEADNQFDKMNHQSVNVTALLKLNTNDAREFLCGWGAAVINVTVTYPVNKVIFRQILEGVPATTAVHQLSHEGVRLLYRGILPPLCQKTLSLSLMFSIYEGCRQRLYVLTEHKTFAKIFAANFAGTCEAILMPLERVQTLLQDWRYHDKFKNTPHAFSILLREYGLSECYRGLVPIIYRNGLSNLMFFTLREQSKYMLKDDNSLLSNFISGALIGGFTSTVFYPVNVIKVHMQSKIGGDFEKFSKCVQDIYIARNRSIKSFYKGVHLNFMRSFISWGVINASYDALKNLLF